MVNHARETSPGLSRRSPGCLQDHKTSLGLEIERNTTMETIFGKKMFDVKEVSEITTISVRSVEKHLRTGKMKGVKISGKWRVSESSLNDFLDGKFDHDES